MPTFSHPPPPSPYDAISKLQDNLPKQNESIPKINTDKRKIFKDLRFNCQKKSWQSAG